MGFFIFMSIVGEISLGLLIALIRYEFKYSKDNELPVYITSILACFSLVMYIIFINVLKERGLEAFLILSKHIDDNKTRITEENGEAKELYITVDGKEYHFEFERSE